MEIVLKRGGLTARVDTLGGELVSLRDAEGTEYIWGGDPAYWSGRNPILFPIVGGLKDGTVRIVFDSPQRAVTPGQAAVLYEGDVVLGGGVIMKT